MKKDVLTRYQFKKGDKVLFEAVGDPEAIGNVFYLLLSSGSGYSLCRVADEEVAK